jgi:hypothetical protein
MITEAGDLVGVAVDVGAREHDTGVLIAGCQDVPGGGVCGAVAAQSLAVDRDRPFRGTLVSFAAGQPVAMGLVSRSACLTHSRTAVSVRSKSWLTCRTVRSPRWHNSTIPALNSGVNDRRGRARFFAMFSILDVRQNRGRPNRYKVIERPAGSLALRLDVPFGRDRVGALPALI